MIYGLYKIPKLLCHYLFTLFLRDGRTSNVISLLSVCYLYYVFILHTSYIPLSFTILLFILSLHLYFTTYPTLKSILSVFSIQISFLDLLLFNRYPYRILSFFSRSISLVIHVSVDVFWVSIVV